MAKELKCTSLGIMIYHFVVTQFSYSHGVEITVLFRRHCACLWRAIYIFPADNKNLISSFLPLLSLSLQFSQAQGRYIRMQISMLSIKNAPSKKYCLALKGSNRISCERTFQCFSMHVGQAGYALLCYCFLKKCAQYSARGDSPFSIVFLSHKNPQGKQNQMPIRNKRTSQLLVPGGFHAEKENAKNPLSALKRDLLRSLSICFSHFHQVVGGSCCFNTYCCCL